MTLIVFRVGSAGSGRVMPASRPVTEVVDDGWLIRSPGTITGMPGGYGVICSAAIRRRVLRRRLHGEERVAGADDRLEFEVGGSGNGIGVGSESSPAAW